jgi:hypothetical protein
VWPVLGRVGDHSGLVGRGFRGFKNIPGGSMSGVLPGAFRSLCRARYAGTTGLSETLPPGGSGLQAARAEGEEQIPVRAAAERLTMLRLPHTRRIHAPGHGLRTVTPRDSRLFLSHDRPPRLSMSWTLCPIRHPRPAAFPPAGQDQSGPSSTASARLWKGGFIGWCLARPR